MRCTSVVGVSYVSDQYSVRSLVGSLDQYFVRSLVGSLEGSQYSAMIQ